MKIEQEWYYSLDGSVFNSGPYGTRDEAIRAAIELERAPNNPLDFWTGLKTEFKPDFAVTDAILEQLHTEAYDVAGESVDTWPEVDKEDQEAFEAELRDLLERFIPKPEFFLIAEIKDHTIG